MTATYRILLDEMTVAMHLGIYPHEVAPQPVRLSVAMTVTYPAAPSADRIEEVLDYDFLREGILAMARGPGFALQESLCEAVAALCLADPRVTSVTVRSTKTDIYPDARIGCEIERSR
ncbi:dihydroneopterin aldolase [Sphingomonas parapaucimobilis]|jgi:dihydroneopterin aldolase|uniref:Putative dihydroneopterin aldolase n=1 Tax=Sphingomonas parapaucimobilis NBRC 15100 TaxID=1219049 RepID=A0A0A1W9M3_9SPHN|nr:dihydroneopterin aldolase [Sphingomonas parapaucimobilis]GAM02165.1 putative dihydroneopterin aldolase [Sphingomonas parapaucimobilis NBRC 15100]